MTTGIIETRGLVLDVDTIWFLLISKEYGTSGLSVEEQKGMDYAEVTKDELRRIFTETAGSQINFPDDMSEWGEH